MLYVKTPEQVLAMIQSEFSPERGGKGSFAASTGADSGREY